MQMQMILHFLKLVRAQNLLIVAFTQLMVRCFLTEKNESILEKVVDYRIWLIIIGTTFIAASGYIINDYYDVKIDAVNRPNSVLLGRKLKRRPLLLIHFFLNFIGISMAIPLKSWLMMFLFLFSANLLWYYSNHLKRLPFIGNLSVALLSSLAVALPGIYFKSESVILVMYVLLAFFISLIREIIKDMEDIRGDKQFGCKTFPIVYGYRVTKALLFSLLSVFLASLFFMSYYSSQQSLYLMMLVLPFSLVLGYFIYKADRKSDYKRLSLLCKMNMLLGVLSMSLL